MLYTKNKEALFARYSDFLEEIQDEPQGDPAEFADELGSHIWVIAEDSGYSIHYDDIARVEAVLVREDNVYYITGDGYNAFIEPAETVPLTQEQAIAYRNKLIDNMDWESFYESLIRDLKNHPKEWGDLLDKIRPLYKEATASFAYERV